MAKKNHNRKKHDYSKYSSKWNGYEISIGNDEKYYGLHRDGNRVKIDIKRMRKIGDFGIPASVFDDASSIPRHTVYFLPQKIHRNDYVVNQFRDKLKELRATWYEFKNAFSKISSPKDVEDAVRLDRISSGVFDYDEANLAGMMAGLKRESLYQKLWVSQCAQFIHQMATELDALMLRKCVYLGYARKDVSRGSMHDYLNGTMKGRAQIERLPGFNTYTKFFTIWNMLKHNSEDLFEKVKMNYSDMLLTDTYHNGEMSQYYLKIGDDYIEGMIDDLLVFYEALCEVFFDENIQYAHWNYDDYFIEKIQDQIEIIDNPLGII